MPWKNCQLKKEKERKEVTTTTKKKNDFSHFCMEGEGNLPIFEIQMLAAMRMPSDVNIILTYIVWVTVITILFTEGKFNCAALKISQNFMNVVDVLINLLGRKYFWVTWCISRFMGLCIMYSSLSLWCLLASQIVK